MKFIIIFLFSLGSAALASDYNRIPNQLSPDLSVEAGPHDRQVPVPFTESGSEQDQERDPIAERDPYEDADYAPDYQREPDRDYSFANDPRYTGLFCRNILGTHSRWP